MLAAPLLATTGSGRFLTYYLAHWRRYFFWLSWWRYGRGIAAVCFGSSPWCLPTLQVGGDVKWNLIKLNTWLLVAALYERRVQSVECVGLDRVLRRGRVRRKRDEYTQPHKLQPCRTNCLRLCCSSQVQFPFAFASLKRCNKAKLNKFGTGVKNNISKLPGMSGRSKTKTKKHSRLFLFLQLLLWSCSTGNSWRTRLASLRMFTCSQVQINLPRSTINLIRVVFRSTHL